MAARHPCYLALALALASLLACRAPGASSDPTADAPSPPEFPATIELAPEFTGSPVRLATLDGGIVVEVLVEGEGEQATESELVVFEYEAYRAATSERIPGYDRRMRVGDEAGNPIGAALQLVIDGQRPGARARVFVPASFVDASRPARAPAVGDVWLTVAIEQVREYPQIVELDAFVGEPIATKVLDDGIEVHDYTPGVGPAAVDGDLVEVVIIGGTMDGDVYLHNPSEYAHTVEVADGFPKETLDGARVGMLRKYIIPRDYTYPGFAVPKGVRAVPPDHLDRTQVSHGAAVLVSGPSGATDRAGFRRRAVQ
jgi:hypothetical protein